MKTFLLIALTLAVVVGVGFYFMASRTFVIKVQPNEITKIEFQDDVLGNIAPPITDKEVIKKWTQNLSSIKFIKNSDYHLSVILGRVYFEGDDGVPQAVVCANIDQKLLAVAPLTHSTTYTSDQPALYSDIIAYIKTKNPGYYVHQM